MRLLFISNTRMTPETISIIMPVLNEAKYLAASLSRLALTDNEELIVVDGGSSDNTMDIASTFTDRLFQTQTGRAHVMNYGAEQASGDILLFLHADCILPDNAFGIIRETLQDHGVSAGAFLLGIDHPGFWFRVIERAANARAKITSLMYGDQGMFLTKTVFKAAGGFAELPLMEDIEISGRLKRKGKIVFVHPPILASPRRWLHEGLFYTTLRDWTIAFLYTMIRVPPDRLIRYYKEVR